MEIGINENNVNEFEDELDDFAVQEESDDYINDLDNTHQIDSSVEQNQEENNLEDNEDKEDFVTSLLKSRGIEDMTKIKFENEEGYVEEVDWNSLSNKEKLNVLNSSTENIETALDESEILLLNAIRKSGLSTSEYLQHIEAEGVNRYIQNSQESYLEYSVDQYTDDELFIADLMSRMGDITEEEALEALEKAKENEALFIKQIGAIRNEYKTIEDENLRQAQIEQEQQAQEQYEQFTQSVVEQINDLKEFSGYDLNLELDDMQMLFDFITGFDGAGNNHFAKALSDPKVLVQTAWLALNGKQMINDITDYFQKEITKVRTESYKKGLADAKDKANKPNIVFKDKARSLKAEIYNDLDEF